MKPENPNEKHQQYSHTMWLFYIHFVTYMYIIYTNVCVCVCVAIFVVWQFVVPSCSNVLLFIISASPHLIHDSKIRQVKRMKMGREREKEKDESRRSKQHQHNEKSAHLDGCLLHYLIFRGVRLHWAIGIIHDHKAILKLLM